MQTTVFRGRAGLAIAADVWGPEDGPPVILLQGGGQTRHSWGATGDRLGRRGFRAVSVDLRGHGESAWATDGDYSHDALADDLAGVAATFDRPPAVVGASLGGITAMWAVGGRGLDVAAVVLVDIVPKVEMEGVMRIRDFMFSAPDGFASLEDAADAVARYLPHRPRPKNVGGLARNLRLGADGRYRWHWDPAMFLSSPIDHDRIQVAAERIDAPVLLVRGRMSDIVSPEGAREFLQRVPHAEFVDVADAHHMVSGDDNDAFSAAVIEFLTRVVAAG